MSASSEAGGINDVQLIPQHAKTSLIKWLGEDIRKLILHTHKAHLKITTADVLSNEVVANLNTLRLRMLHRAVGNLDSTLVVAKERHLVDEDPVVPQGLPHPQQLGATTSSSHILRFSRRDGDAVLLLGRPRHQ